MYQDGFRLGTRTPVDFVITSDYYGFVTASELKRWLARRGCTFQESRKHTKILRGARFSFMPRHPSKEIKPGTLRSILKALDLEN